MTDSIALAAETKVGVEQTGAKDGNSSRGIGPGEQPNPRQKSYDTYRTMRNDPTIALARALVVAPVVAGEWRVEADDEVDDERIKFVQDQFLGIREPFLETALFAGVDFGWQGFEKVYAVKNGQIVLKKIKPLYHNITTILVDAKTGVFAGFTQPTGTLPVGNSLLIPFRVEGTKWHGTSLLENIRATFTQCTDANASAARYDKRLAGVQPIVKYPLGDTFI